MYVQSGPYNAKSVDIFQYIYIRVVYSMYTHIQTIGLFRYPRTNVGLGAENNDIKI